MTTEKPSIGSCPVCNTELLDESPIAYSCPNVLCPVEDDPDLWYQDNAGNWKSQKWVLSESFVNEQGQTIQRLRLTEKEM